MELILTLILRFSGGGSENIEFFREIENLDIED